VRVVVVHPTRALVTYYAGDGIAARSVDWLLGVAVLVSPCIRMPGASKSKYLLLDLSSMRIPLTILVSKDACPCSISFLIILVPFSLNRENTSSNDKDW
jgi:hypothetical protein